MGSYASWNQRARDTPRQVRTGRGRRLMVGELLAGQWQVIAMLGTVLALDLVGATRDSAVSGAALPEFGSTWVILVSCGLVMSAIAVVATRRPIEAAGLGAVVLVGTAVVRWALGCAGPLPASAVVAGLVLVTLVIRHARSERAERAAMPVVAVLAAVAVLSAIAAMYAQAGLAAGGGSTRGYLLWLCTGGLLMVIAVGAGMSLRARDEERAAAVRGAAVAAQQAERMDLARELHDVVAHHLTGIVVQAQAGRLVAARNPAAATNALGHIDDSGTAALTALRRLIAGMRASCAGSSAEQVTTDFAADLRALLSTRLSGQRALPGGVALPEVDLHLDLAVDVPQEIARSVLRVVRESLTNVERHALGVRRVRVRVHADPAWLRVVVSDDGTGLRRPPAGGSGGFGLIGMRERIELLGGDFRAGPGPGGGWQVAAELPLELREPLKRQLGGHDDSSVDRR